MHLVGAIKSGGEKDLDMVWSIILSLIFLASELGGNWEICTRSFHTSDIEKQRAREKKR